MKKIRIPSEAVYFIAIIVMALSVAMISASDFGLSMIVSPAYLVSLKIGISFGQGEYIMQGIMFIILCILMRKVKLVYFVSFLTGLIYGAVLDLWRLIPLFDPSKTPPETISMPARILLFAFGMMLTSFAVALFFKVYIYAQVYDFFIVAVAVKYKLNVNKFKIIFDFSFLALSVILTFALFGKIVGIGWGTLVMAALNGVMITLFGKVIDKTVEIKPGIPRLAEKFAIN